MKIEVGSATGDAALVTCAGRLTGEAAEELLARATAALGGEAPRLLLDLAGVEYVTSSAIGSIVRLCKEVKDRGGVMVICAPQERVRLFFEIAGADALVRVVRTREEALAALGCGEGA